MLSMKKVLFCSLFIPTCIAGCTSSSEVIVTQFDQMLGIVQAHPGDCKQIGDELNAFMESHAKALSRAVRNNDSTKKSDARQIFNASLKIHKLTAHCKSESMEKFRATMSEIVLQNATSND